MKRWILPTIVCLMGIFVLSSCTTSARERRQEKRERKKWEDDGKSRWQKWQEWEKKKGQDMWQKFKTR